jgi:uncharacterized membrane protein YbhN (UPF0104 family)
MGREASKEDPSEASRFRLSVFRVLLGLAMTVAVFWMLIRFVGGAEQLAVSPESLQLMYLPLALSSSAFGIYAAASRMRLALLLTGDRVTRWAAVRAVLSAWPVSILTPARGGDFLRAMFLAPRIPLTRGLGAIVAEKIIDAFVLIAIGSTFALILGQKWLAGLGLFGLIVGLSLVRTSGWVHWLSALPFGRRLWERFCEIGEAARQMRKQPRLVLALSSWSVVAVGNGALLIYLLLCLVGQNLESTAVGLRWPVAMLAGAVPVTPAGMGTRDAAFVFLLHPDQRTGGVVLACVLYSLTSGWIYALVGLPLFLKSQLHPPKQSAKLDS